MARDVSGVENLISEKSLFQGRFALNGNLCIDGKYEGDYLEVDSLLIGKSGKAKTHIIANNVIVEGVVIGSIHARVRVMLYPTAKILGDIETPELIIQNGVVFEGSCKIANDQSQSAGDIVRESYEAE